MKTLLTITLAATLAGCAQHEWRRPDTTQAQFDRDRAECDYQSDAAVAGVSSGIAAGIRAGALFRKCMEARGYRSFQIN